MSIHYVLVIKNYKDGKISPLALSDMISCAVQIKCSGSLLSFCSPSTSYLCPILGHCHHLYDLHIFHWTFIPWLPLSSLLNTNGVWTLEDGGHSVFSITFIRRLLKIIDLSSYVYDFIILQTERKNKNKKNFKNYFSDNLTFEILLGVRSRLIYII